MTFIDIIKQNKVGSVGTLYIHVNQTYFSQGAYWLEIISALRRNLVWFTRLGNLNRKLMERVAFHHEGLDEIKKITGGRYKQYHYVDK